MPTSHTSAEVTAKELTALREENAKLRDELRTARMVVQKFEQAEGLLASAQRSHDQSKAIFDAASQVSVIVTGLAHKVTMFSRGAELLLGYTAAEVEGKVTPALFHLAEEIEAYATEMSQKLGRSIPDAKVFTESARQGRSELRDWTYVRKDGSHVAVSLSVAALHDEDKRIIGYVGTAVDISQQKATLASLTAEREHLQFILDTAPVGIGVSTDNVLRYANPKLHGLIDKNIGELSRDLFVNGEERDAIVAEITRGAKVMDQEVQMYGHARIVHDVSASFLPINYEGKPGVLAWVIDITASKLARKELLAAMQARQEAFTALEKERRLLQYILDTAPVGVGISTGNIVRFANPQLHKIINVKHGKSTRDLYVHTAERDAIAERVTGGAEIKDQEIQMYAPDGGIRDISASFLPIEYEGTHGVLVWMIDITERKQAQEELTAALQDRQEAFASLATERERLQYILDAAPVGIAVSADNVLRFTNPKFREMFDIKVGGLTHELFVNLDVLAAYQAQVLGGTQLMNVEIQMYGHGGAIRDISNTCVPIEYEGMPGALAWMTDITDQKQSKKVVAEQRRNLDIILDNLPDATFVINRQGVVMTWNRAAEELTGVKAEDMVGRGDYEYALPFYGERRPVLIDLVFQPQEDILAQYTHVRRVGEVLLGEGHIRCGKRETWFEGSAIALRDAQGDVTGAIEMLRDCTERKRFEDEMAIAKAAAEEANATKSAFLANMSHELRTPLNAIIGYSEMLQEELAELGEEILAQDSGKIQSAGKHLLALINDVLDISKVEAGKMELCIETIDVPTMIAEVESIIAPLVKKHANVLSVDCPEGLPPIHADIMKLRQSLFNLLSNACKFSRESVIRLGVAEDDDWITFTVADSGIGMTPRQVDKLFQLFSQADASTTRQFGGTGLGLAISRSFCRLMGGDITVESEFGKGTTFTIRLPVIVAGPKALAEPSETTTAAEQAAPGDTRPVALVVDDDPASCDILKRCLEERYRVVTAHDGEVGLRLAAQLIPAIITLDAIMPRTDGWTMLSRLKADADLAHIPVVMVSFLNDHQMAFALGAAHYLTKPIDRDKLRTVLEQYKGKRHVLLIEDDHETRTMMRRMLEKNGWSVGEAENGKVGLDRMSETLPDVILLDLMMPVMDGFEFVTELRRLEDWRTVPIIVLTAKDITAAECRRLEGRAQRILQKGAVKLDDLAAQIRSLLPVQQP